MSRLLVVTALVAVAACSDQGATDPESPQPDPEGASVTRAFASGSLLYLERTQDADTIRLGLDTRWGGTIVELSVNGTNVVNAHDTGREIQVAFYDGTDGYEECCAGPGGIWGWDPVQGGDKWNAGTQVSEWSLAGDSLYVKARPLEWNPDDKGGGPDRPVESDVVVEQWVVAVADHLAAFRVHYRLTHLGTDDHGAAAQEVPAVYADVARNRLIYYGGGSPWSRGPVTTSGLATLGTDLGPERYTSEHWASLVDDQGVGVTVYTPESMPYVSGFLAPGAPGPNGDGTTYFRALTPFDIGPGARLDFEIFVIAGTYSQARETVYALHPNVLVQDILAPIGSLDTPESGAIVTGIAEVAGWAWDMGGVVRVDVLVDDLVVGNAAYGLPRRDVAIAYPGAPVGTGFAYALNTTALPNGAHIVVARAWDAVGHTVRLAKPIEVHNLAAESGWTGVNPVSWSSHLLGREGRPRATHETAVSGAVPRTSRKLARQDVRERPGPRRARRGLRRTSRGAAIDLGSHATLWHAAQAPRRCEHLDYNRARHR